MRIISLTLLSIAALAPAASAQTDGCLQANPCLLDVEVDESGIASVSVTTLTSGDWFYLSVSNVESRAHTIQFHATSIHVGAYGYEDSVPFVVPAPGTYQLMDQPTGDSAAITVVAGDSVAAEQSSDASGAPGLPAFALVAGLVALAFLRRR